MTQFALVASSAVNGNVLLEEGGAIEVQGVPFTPTPPTLPNEWLFGDGSSGAGNIVAPTAAYAGGDYTTFVLDAAGSLTPVAGAPIIIRALVSIDIAGLIDTSGASLQTGPHPTVGELGAIFGQAVSGLTGGGGGGGGGSAGTTAGVTGGSSNVTPDVVGMGFAQGLSGVGSGAGGPGGAVTVAGTVGQNGGPRMAGAVLPFVANVTRLPGGILLSWLSGASGAPGSNGPAGGAGGGPGGGAGGAGGVAPGTPGAGATSIFLIAPLITLRATAILRANGAAAAASGAGVNGTVGAAGAGATDGGGGGGAGASGDGGGCGAPIVAIGAVTDLGATFSFTGGAGNAGGTGAAGGAAGGAGAGAGAAGGNGSTGATGTAGRKFLVSLP